MPSSDRKACSTPRLSAALAHQPDTRSAAEHRAGITGADGAPLNGVYGIGLAAGFVPWGRLGGEPSFRGQANGLWQWQNDVGLMIVDQLIGDRVRAVA